MLFLDIKSRSLTQKKKIQVRSVFIQFWNKWPCNHCLRCFVTFPNKSITPSYKYTVKSAAGSNSFHIHINPDNSNVKVMGKWKAYLRWVLCWRLNLQLIEFLEMNCTALRTELLHILSDWAKSLQIRCYSSAPWYLNFRFSSSTGQTLTLEEFFSALRLPLVSSAEER